MNPTAPILQSPSVVWNHGSGSCPWPSQTWLATVSIPDQSLATSTEDARTADYAAYVILPLILLIGAMMALRKAVVF